MYILGFVGLVWIGVEVVDSKFVMRWSRGQVYLGCIVEPVVV